MLLPDQKKNPTHRSPPSLSSDYEEITIDPACGWRPVPVKPDLHIKEEPDGPVLKRCRTVSPSHMVLPNVMEMIAARGPTSAPYQGLAGGGRNTPDYNRPGRFKTEEGNHWWRLYFFINPHIKTTTTGYL